MTCSFVHELGQLPEEPAATEAPTRQFSLSQDFNSMWYFGAAHASDCTVTLDLVMECVPGGHPGTPEWDEMTVTRPDSHRFIAWTASRYRASKLRAMFIASESPDDDDGPYA
ncbi:hypothetical protein H4R35_006980 [Dimargaris xerosporica]|nr:hypothetical protein H4R35_006980 [Dimargaris xerosporica]